MKKKYYLFTMIVMMCIIFFMIVVLNKYKNNEQKIYDNNIRSMTIILDAYKKEPSQEFYNYFLGEFGTFYNLYGVLYYKKDSNLEYLGGIYNILAEEPRLEGKRLDSIINLIQKISKDKKFDTIYFKQCYEEILLKGK